MAPYLPPTYVNQHSIDRENVNTSLHRTLLATPNDSDRRNMDLVLLRCGNRYRITPHYQCNRFHPCSRPVDEWRGWHCTAPPRCPILLATAPQRKCSLYDPDTLREFSISKVFPYRNPFPLPMSELIGNPIKFPFHFNTLQ